jgi:4-hydroxy-tetrahydrodipicolinate reductase
MKVAVNGAAGAMGRRIISLLSEKADCRLVCALERGDHPSLGQDAGVLAGTGTVGVPLTTRLGGQPDVLVDFSAPESTMARARECAAAGTAVVIGTTGLSEDQVAELRQKVAARVPVLVTPNMSIGVNLLFRLVGEVAKALGDGYDIEIVEAHHRRKKDAPSGTAAELARRICAALDRDPAAVLRFGREGICGPRTLDEIGVHAILGGDIVGDHTVIFAGEGERVELVHKASSRDVFARGAIRAATFLAGRKPGIYTMQDVLA